MSDTTHLRAALAHRGINAVETALVVAIVFVATFMAWGVWLF